MPRKARIPKREKKPGSRKTGVTPKRFRKDPAFKGSRRAMAEFGLGSRAATLLRRAFAIQISNIPQNETHKQLTSSITTLVREKKAAGTQRIRLNQLEWEKLKNFEFNPQVYLSTLLMSDFRISIEPGTATVTISLSGVQVTGYGNTLPEIAYMAVTAGAAAIDFEKEIISKDNSATAHIPREAGTTEEINLVLHVKPPLVHPLFIVLGFTIFMETGGRLYELSNLRYRALSIVHIHPAAPPSTKKKTMPRSKAPVKTAKPKVTAKPARKKQVKKPTRPKNKRRRL